MKSERDDFFAEKSVAVVGVSRTRGFGNLAFQELKRKGWRVWPVNEQADEVEGERCFRRLDDIPEKVGAVLVVVPPAQAAKVVADCARLGIGRVWMQQGSESEGAVRLCHEKGLAEVHGACALMFAQPRSVHRVHRWVARLFGKA